MRSYCLLFLFGTIIFTLSIKSAFANQCDLLWKVDQSGRYEAELVISKQSEHLAWFEKLTDHSQKLPPPVRGASSIVRRPDGGGGEIRYQLQGLLQLPERAVGEALLEWLKEGSFEGTNPLCTSKHIVVRSQWRYQHVPSSAQHAFGETNASSSTTLLFRRLSAETSRDTHREYFGVEIVNVTATDLGKRQEGEAYRQWVEKLFLETDLRQPGVIWNDRPLEVQFPSGPRSELGAIFGSYAPFDQKRFGMGIRGAIISESALSSTVFWRRNYFGTRAVFGDFDKLDSAGLKPLSIFDLHLATGLHWRPRFHANDAYASGVRNFIAFSSTVGIHRVFAWDGNPSLAKIAFTAPSLDLGIYWGGYNRKMDLMVGMEAHYLQYLSDVLFGSNLEFALSFGF